MMCAEFDQVVQESRRESEQAAQLMPGIEENIYNAESSTYEALAALEGANNLASAAEELALAAQNLSNSALVVCNVTLHS